MDRHSPSVSNHRAACPEAGRTKGLGDTPPAVMRGMRMSRCSLRIWLTGGLIAVSCGMAAAQTFYKWTDDQGVVHFSDEPPAQAKHVEERKLPEPQAAAPAEVTEPEPAKAAAVGEADTGGANPAATTFTGPARVVMVTRETPRSGPRSLHVFGQVKNVGGVDAHKVAVTISAVDVSQGTPCLQEETEVVPSTLHPGEIGHFDVDVESPCLVGEAPVDVAPVWQ